MSETKVSVFIVTLNEAGHIADAIRSVAELDEVVVVDSGSTDDTVRLAESLGAKVIHQEWLGFAKQKNFAMQQCRNEWCLNIDGDEVVPAETLSEMRTLIDNDRCDMIRIPIEDVFVGRPMHPLSRKRSIVRAFKKSEIRYPTDRLVHENVTGDGREIRIRNKLTHYGYDSIYTFMQKHNKYASLAAQTKFNRGKSFSLFKLVTVFPLTFIKVYFFRRLFLSGTRGLIQARIEAMYAFLKESYLYEQSTVKERK